MKRVFKWVLRLTLAAIVLTVVLALVFFLSLDSILRRVIEHNVRDQTGMAVEIKKFHFGLTEPVVEIKNLELYNSKEYGGTPFLNIPEIHVEYDRDALRKNVIHITLLRFNLGELDIVKNQAGQTNIFALGLQLPPTNVPVPAGAITGGPSTALKEKTGMEFKGIDCLDVSVGRFKYLDLQDQRNNQEQTIGIHDCLITNVASVADLTGLAVLVGLRGGDFFKPLIDPNNSTAGYSTEDILKLLGH